MIRIAGNVAADIVRRADELDQTAVIQAAKTLPGYGTHERVIRSQFAPRESSRSQSSAPIGRNTEADSSR